MQMVTKAFLYEENYFYLFYLNNWISNNTLKLSIILCIQVLGLKLNMVHNHRANLDERIIAISL